MKKSSIIITLLLLILTTSAALSQTPEGETYIVQPGDALNKIAETAYGDGSYYPGIIDATNAKAAEDDSFTVIQNPNLIVPGQKLWIPTLAETAPTEATPEDEVTATTAMPDLEDYPYLQQGEKFSEDKVIPVILAECLDAFERKDSKGELFRR